MKLQILRILNSLTHGIDLSPRQVDWILYEDGKLATPIRVISDADVDDLVAQIVSQRATAARIAEKP